LASPALIDGNEIERMVRRQRVQALAAGSRAAFAAEQMLSKTVWKTFAKSVTGAPIFGPSLSF
jgi:hypothetical protein